MNKLDAHFDFAQTALRIRAQRQEVLAANIANADTPNYKAKDIDFASAMKQAMQASQSAPGRVGGSAGVGGSVALTHALHIAQTADMPEMPGLADASGVKVQFRHGHQSGVDGNTVDPDVERNQFLDNVLKYEASLSMVNGKISSLKAALQSN